MIEPEKSGRAVVQAIVTALAQGKTPERLAALKRAQDWLDATEYPPTYGDVRDAYHDWMHSALNTYALYERWTDLQAREHAGAAIAISQWQVDLSEAHRTLLEAVAAQ